MKFHGPNIWLLTDTHFNHNTIRHIRDERFEDKIVSGVKSRVAKNDIFIHLGDIGARQQHYVAMLQHLKEVQAKTILIRGNHDTKHPQLRLLDEWGVVVDGLRIKKYGFDFWLSHEPILIPEGVVNVHGHHHLGTHRDPEWRTIEQVDNKGTHVLLSLEIQGYAPIKLLDIANWLGGHKSNHSLVLTSEVFETARKLLAESEEKKGASYGSR